MFLLELGESSAECASFAEDAWATLEQELVRIGSDPVAPRLALSTECYGDHLSRGPGLTRLYDMLARSFEEVLPVMVYREPPVQHLYSIYGQRLKELNCSEPDLRLRYNCSGVAQRDLLSFSDYLTSWVLESGDIWRAYPALTTGLEDAGFANLSIINMQGAKRTRRDILDIYACDVLGLDDAHWCNASRLATLGAGGGPVNSTSDASNVGGDKIVIAMQARLLWHTIAKKKDCRKPEFIDYFRFAHGAARRCFNLTKLQRLMRLSDKIFIQKYRANFLPSSLIIYESRELCEIDAPVVLANARKWTFCDFDEYQSLYYDGPWPPVPTRPEPPDPPSQFDTFGPHNVENSNARPAPLEPSAALEAVFGSAARAEAALDTVTKRKSPPAR